MLYGLEDCLITERHPHNPSLLSQPYGYAAPGYWVCATALAHKAGVTLDEMQLNPAYISYAKALCIESVLGQKDSYPHTRHNRGANYSPLVVLASQNETDSANETICSCIQQQFAGIHLKPFVDELLSVVGDLHDNVWSHGCSTGISMAQYWGGKRATIEFALADCGYGLLGELKRSGYALQKGISTHKDAIEWCIQEGNSTKKQAPSDGWEQTLPEDCAGTPLYGVKTRVRTNGNNHLGLGLFKAVSLVDRYGGELWLASGDAMLRINSDGTKSLLKTINWDGVAVACRFAVDNVKVKCEAVHPSQDDLGKMMTKIVRGEP